MHTSHAVTRRLYMAVMSVEMLIGLSLYLFPARLGTLAAPEAPLSSDNLAWPLVMGAFLLLAALEPSFPRWARIALRWLASLPLAALGVRTADWGDWPLAFCIGLVALGLLIPTEADRTLSAEPEAEDLREEAVSLPEECQLLPGGMERLLLIWLWALGFGVAVVATLAGGEVVASRPATALFLLAVSTYLMLRFRRQGRFASPAFRVASHFTVVGMTLSVLLMDPGPMGHFFLAPLAAALALAVPTVGNRLVRLVASLCALLLIVGNLHHWLLHGWRLVYVLSETLVEVAVLAAAVEMGVRLGSMERRLLRDTFAAQQTAERQARRMAMINRVSRIISATLHPDEMLHTASQELSGALETHGCLICLVEGRTAVWPPKVEAGLEGQIPLVLQLGERLSDSSLPLTDVSSGEGVDLLPVPLREGLERQGIRALLLVPILVQQQFLGVVALLHRTSREWTSDDCLVTEGVTSGLGVGLLNARIHEQLLQSNGYLQSAQEELQAQNEELQSVQEELQAQNEELQAQNEESAAQQETLQEQRQQLEAALQYARQSEERFRSTFEHAPIGMALVGPDGTLQQVNQSLCRMLGYSEEELLGRTYRQLTHPDDIPRNSELNQALRRGEVETYELEKRYIHKDGHVVWALLSASAIRNEDGPPIYRIAHVLDISDRKQSEAQLLHLARFDPLTDLLNRRGFQEEIDRNLSEAMHQGFEGALLYMDLDQFKFVNDSMGHQAGDLLLQGVAKVIRSQLRDTDPVSRLGGDEFAAFLPHTSPEVAQEIANRVLEAVRRHVEVIAGHRVNTTASIGLAFYPQDGQNSHELLAKADLAMYLAKDSGRDRLYSSDPGSPAQERMESKLSWEHRIREALEHEWFVLHWQPIRNLRDNETRQFELLLRMVDETGQIIPPAAFLDTAERFGLIHAIDRWVVSRAITLLAEYQKAGIDLCLEVNLSGRAFEDEQLLSMIREQIAATGINPHNLIMEITETAAIKDLDAASRFIETLRDLGCRFAIDDFGTGFASLYYVKRLAVDYLKIDGSFITNLAKDPVDQHLVRAMVDVAKGLGKLTVAEFVEDEETVRLLQEYGVDFAQGYHIGRPRPLGDYQEARWGGHPNGDI